MGNGQWVMGNGQWTMDNGQWTMKRENVIKEKSFDFALRIVKLYKYLQEKKSLS